MIKFLFILFFALNAKAGFPPTTTKGQTQSSKSTTFDFQMPFNQVTKTSATAGLIHTGNFNLLKNSGFEATAYSSDWSSAMAISAPVSGDIAFGAKGVSLDASAASQDFTSAQVEIPAGLRGQNGEASVWVKTSATDYLLQVYDGVNIVASQTISASSAFYRAALNFIYPSSGNIQLRIRSSSNAGQIYADEAYLGSATNISQVSQSKSAIQLSWTGTLAANHDADTLLTFSSATFTKLENFTHSSGVFTATVAGDYKIQCGARQTWVNDNSVERIHTIKIYKNSSSVPTVPMGQIPGQAQNDMGGGGEPGSNANTNPATHGLATLSLAVGDTIRCKYYTNNGNGTNRSVDAAWVFVEYFPTSSQQAINPNATPSYWSGYHDATCSWARTNASYGDFGTDASCALVQRIAANISCSVTGSVLPAVACTFPKAGVYHICATVPLYGGAATGHGLKLWDGTTTIVEGATVVTSSDTFSLCGFYSASSTTATFTIQGKAASNSINIDNVGATSTIEWKIWPLGQNEPVPILVGSVTSNTSGTERIERAEVNCDASSSITSQSGTWLTAIGNRSTAACSITIATGIFSATPSCTFTAKASAVQATAVNMTSATAGTVYGASSDYDGYLLCMGPR